MHVTKLYPLRTTIGPPVEVKTIELIEESEEARKLNFAYTFNNFEARPLHGESTLDEFYDALTSTKDTAQSQRIPADGVMSLPTHPELPFGFQDPMCMLFGLARHSVTNETLSRQLSLKLKIGLKESSLIGGISFLGYPYFNCHVKPQGETQMNFGLPREITVISFDSKSQTAFLDSQLSYKEQRVISHSGFHYIKMDPVFTNTIELHISDYPILKYGQADVGKQTPMHFGFILPSLYIFKYVEGSRYHPNVPTGLLGLNKLDKSNNAIPTKEDPAYTLKSTYNNPLTNTETTEYAEFTPGSALGPQRKYKFKGAHESDRRKYTECFISKKMEPGQKIILFIEQGEEHQRCIAGLKIQGPTPSPDTGELKNGPNHDDPNSTINTQLEIPEVVEPCNHFRLRIYELDPPEGISPTVLDRSKEYVTLLADSTYTSNQLPQLMNGLRFIRPSTARYFAVELENRESNSSQFVIKSLRLVQSANVSVQPRPAYNQYIQAIHFRFVGEDLADDYASLGEKGFNFSVERLIAGQTKDVLLEARSLLDLLHLGVARIYSNGRRRGVEMETSETVRGKPNVEHRHTQVKTAGWRRSEIGPKVDALNKWTSTELPFAPGPIESRKKFEAFTRTETRSRNFLPYPFEQSEWAAARNYFNLISDIATVGTRVDPVPNNDNILNRTWLNPRWNEHNNFAAVGGLRVVNMSPFSAINTLEEFFRRIKNEDDEAFASALTAIAGAYAMILTGGTNSSLSAAPFGLGMSIGINPVPSLTYNTTFGSTANVLNSGTESLFSYSQAKNHVYDDADSSSTIKNAVSNRKITRTSVRGTDQNRVKGAEVMWQGSTADIITGSIPLNIKLPATANKIYDNSDDVILVRLGSGVQSLLSVDIWFDLTEELVRNDY